jgi:hypothetical protein
LAIHKEWPPAKNNYWKILSCLNPDYAIEKSVKRTINTNFLKSAENRKMTLEILKSLCVATP